MSYKPPRCQVVPLPNEQVALEIDGRERLRWHYGAQYPRPFFYPLLGPSGQSLTRIGHPGAPNHDHHRSVWFAHNKVLGIDFWSDNTEARIRQQQWLAYEDRDDEARMAVQLGWYDGHDPAPLLEQELVAAVRPTGDGETLLELQATFRPRAESLELGQTNFGFLAVRVSRHLSAYFGGGQLTGSSGKQGEPNLFGRQARWMDYSGPMPKPAGIPGTVDEGITYFDHPSNFSYPSSWHVREDGWMGCSPCMHEPRTITREQPLVLRYLLYAHRGLANAARADELAESFANTSAFTVRRSEKKHTHMDIVRDA